MINRLTSGVLWLALVIAAAGMCLGGCGQKGPLYLPDELQQYRN